MFGSILLKLYMNGLGRFPLCLIHGEDLSHIFIGYSYMADMWRYVYDVTQTPFIWEFFDLCDAFRRWLNTPYFHSFKALPTILIWETWRAQNYAIFHDLYIPPTAYTVKSLIISEQFP